MALVDVLVPAALAALALVGVVALRHRILAAMGWRNTQRRPKQSALVVLGLLVGTALISGALVASDSLEFAIVEATYDAFLEVDETVHLDGYNFFPREVEFALADHAALAAVTDAVGSNVLWDASAVNRDTALYEPRIRLVGFDPDRDRAFGEFRDGDRRFTGESLRPGEVVLNRDLARVLGAEVGHRLDLNFTLPVDPLVPEVRRFTGQIQVSAGGLPPLDAYAEPQPWTRAFDLPPGAVRVTAALLWDPGAANQDLDVRLVAPGGATFRNANGTVGQPDVPAFLNVSGSLAQPLASGSWTLGVSAKAAASTPFQVAVVAFVPVYDLAELERRAGDAATSSGFEVPDAGAFVGRATRTVTVAALTDGGKGPNFALPTALNLYLRLDDLQGWLGRAGEVNFVKVSNVGGVEAGARRTAATMPVLWAALNETKAALPPHPAVQALLADDDKRFWLRQAEEVGDIFGVFLTSVASFSVIAGLLLIVNIFTMLAEERRTELGISRAVGLRRSDLTRLFVLEGALYALPAAVVGTFAGLGLAALLIAGFNVFSPGSTALPHVPFRVEARSLLLAFSTGTLLTLGTVYVGARRASRLNIVRAIRSLEEPEHLRTRLAGVAGGGLAGSGTAVVGLATLTGNFTALILGPTLLALGLGLLLRRRFPRRIVYPWLAVGLFVHLAVTLFAVRNYESAEANIVGPARAVLMALCVVVLVVYGERTARALGAVASRLRPLRAVALVAISYPLQRKFRTGMTLSMYSVILLVVSLFTIFGTLFTPDPEREAGGYDVQGYAHVPFERLEDHGTDRSVLARVERYDALPYHLRYGGDVIRVNNETPGQFGPPRDWIFGIDDGFARANAFALLRRDAAHATDRDAYRAVAASDDLAIVAYPYSTDEQGNDDVHRVGDRLQVRARGGVREFTIAGIQEQSHFKGVFVSRAALDDLGVNVETLVLVRLRAGEDPAAAARALEAAYRDVGMDAASIREVVLEESQQFRQIFTLIQIFLGLGLVVGILSLGIVTARSVIERRQEIGMLRAIGTTRRQVARAFLAEILAMVTVGVAIGAALAVLVAFGLWVAIIRELRIPFAVPWDELAVIAVVAYVATTLATLAPILRAAKVPPAEALRYIE